jgi:hypothetical protein
MKTLAEALTLVPTHFPLVPGVDKWKEGDESFIQPMNKTKDKAFWLKVGSFCIGRIITEERISGHSIDMVIARRPIPQSVREAEAYRYLMDGDLHPEYRTPVIMTISDEGLKLARKHKHPLLAWVEENRK